LIRFLIGRGVIRAAAASSHAQRRDPPGGQTIEGEFRRVDDP
jgi:hypothetical protein